MEKAGDVLEALLGMTIWILSGRPMRLTPFTNSDVVLLLAPETDYFRKISAYMIHFDWLNRIHNGLLLGTTDYPSIPKSVLKDQLSWDRLRMKVGSAPMPQVCLERFRDAMESHWGIIGYLLSQEDTNWWINQAVLKERLDTMD